MSGSHGLIANKGLELLTFWTPNGHKISILLEELKEAYGKPDYVFQSIDIHTKVQKEPWYIKLAPSGKVPALVDHDNGGLGIMEGSAIVSYLVRHFDPEHRFTFKDDPELSLSEQWVAWQHGELGPMQIFDVGVQNQANQYYRLYPERDPFPTQKFVGETERLFGVLENQLKGRRYLVADKYSIADIVNFSWVNFSSFAGIDLEKFPNLYQWWQRIKERPAVQRGTHVPSVPFLTNDAYAKRLQEEPELKKKDDDLQANLKRAQEQYQYQFSTP